MDADRLLHTDDTRSAPAAIPGAPSLPRAIVSGFVASVTMLFAFGIAYAAAALLAGSRAFDHPSTATLRQWFHGLTTNALIDLARPNLYAALAVYFIGGLGWATLYAYVFRPRSSGPEWRRGLAFALVPWLFSLLAFLPLVGGGLFGLALGAGPLPVIGNLVLHVVYGVTLAEVYGPLWDVSPDGEGGAATGADTLANRGSETGAAQGLLVGLAAGALAGLAAVSLSLAAGEIAPLGSSPASLLLATTLLGGALVGSFVGLSPAAPRP